MKYKKTITYEIEHYPKRCNECPAFRQTPYVCHNERGIEADCELGYMNGSDMRDFYGRVKFSGCCIEDDERVTVIHQNNN